MRIFVTGFHRAGSKGIARHIAKTHNLPYIEEHSIGLWDYRRVTALIDGFVHNAKTNKLDFYPEIKKGFVLQCPFLSHKIQGLVWLGKVYWADRNYINIITSMKNGKFKADALFIIKQFHDEFPDDPYWESFGDVNIDKYFALKSGEKFPQIKTSANNWLRYYKLVIDVKKYFLETKFKGRAEVIKLENLPIYDSSKHLSGKKPLTQGELDVIERTNNG